MRRLLIRRVAGSSPRRVPAAIGKGRSRCHVSPVTRRYSSTQDLSTFRRKHHFTKSPWRLLSSIPQRNENEPDASCNDPDEYLPDDISTEELTTSKKELSKIERKRLHEEKYRLAQLRRESSRRKLHSEGWMALFASSEDLFRAALRELNVDKEWRDDKMSNERDSVLDEYRSFYLDSLNSFGVAVAEKDTESDISEATFKSLDDFAQSSFADPEFSSKYIRMRRRQERRDELEASLMQNVEDHSQAMKILVKEESFLNEVKGNNEASNNDDFNDLEKIEQEVNTSLLKLFKADATKITKQENIVQRAKDRVLSLNRRIENTQSALEDIEFPFSQQDYNNATTELVRISSQIIPDLAKFITSRHADFEKLRLLEEHTDLTKPQVRIRSHCH